MRKNRTIRQLSTLFAVVILMIPVAVLSVVSQFGVWAMIRDTMLTNVDQTLHATSQMFDMVLEQYTSILYNFCTDDDVIRLVKYIIVEEDELLDSSANQLRRKLNHAASQAKGIEGITLVTQDGKIFFYDRSVASFAQTIWADRVKIPEECHGNVYQSGHMAIREKKEENCLIQVCRRVIDYQNIDRELGTVVMSINQDEIWNHIPENQNSSIYICEDGTIIASRQKERLNQPVTSIGTKNYQIQSLVNDKTGWTIYNYYFMNHYYQLLLLHMAAWIAGIVVFSLVFSFFIQWYTKPVIMSAQELLEGMAQAKQGDFSVRVAYWAGATTEQNRIADGFNEMVVQLDNLMKQVKQSMLEQRNAELSAMEAQIDPHFLYNTLDTINWKALELEQYQISEMLGALADILRYSIRNPGTTVSVREEIRWLEQYILLQKEKLEHGLEFEIYVPEAVMNYRIHKLLLQPFVENAIRHGLCCKKEECRLAVRIHLAEEQLHVVIMDNGAGIAPELLKKINRADWDAGNHVGISNVKKRLKMYYGEDAEIYFESEEGRGTAAHLFVKAIQEGEYEYENRNSGG